MSPDDKRWPWLVYGTVLVPLIGQPLVVLASSIHYYRWRKPRSPTGQLALAPELSVRLPKVASVL